MQRPSTVAILSSVPPLSANPFFDHPIPNPSYAPPKRDWELDADRGPTPQVIERRRRADFITPIPESKKRTAARRAKAKNAEGTAKKRVSSRNGPVA